jgi:hypothetical protein
MRITPEILAWLGYISADDYIQLTEAQNEFVAMTREQREQKSERMLEIWRRRKESASIVGAEHG